MKALFPDSAAAALDLFTLLLKGTIISRDINVLL